MISKKEALTYRNTIEVAVQMAKKLVENGLSKNEAAKEIAKETGLKKSDIYKSLQNG